MANRVSNPSFETDLSGWTADAFVATTFVRSSDWATDGSWSARLSFTDATAGRNSGWRTPTGVSGIPVTPGETLLLEVDLNIVTPANGAYVRLYWYLSSGAAATPPNVTSPLKSVDGKFEFEVVVPANAVYASVCIGAQSNGPFDAYFDNIILDTAPVRPDYSSKGAMVGTATSGAAHNVPCPAVVNAGQLLIAFLMYEGLTVDPSTPAGWTLLRGPDGSGTFRMWVFGKIADGTEDGVNVNFGSPASTVNRYGIIYSFDDVRNDTITNVIGGFGFESGTTAQILDSAVTTPEDNCLAVNLIGIADDNAVGPFVGAQGGVWTEATPEDLHNALTPDQCMQLQIAPMYSPGSIDTGSYTMAAADPWGVVGFYIRGPAVSTPPSSDTDNFFAFI